HADAHAIVFAPSNSSIVYEGNDGGIFKSTDAGATWSSLNNSTFSATQFQSIAIHPTDRWFTIGGTQDNGTEFLHPSSYWRRADFGDGGYAVIDQSATDTTTVTMYHTYFNSAGTSGLQGFSRVTMSACATEAALITEWCFRGNGVIDPSIGCEGVVRGAANG